MFCFTQTILTSLYTDPWGSPSPQGPLLTWASLGWVLTVVAPRDPCSQTQPAASKLSFPLRLPHVPQAMGLAAGLESTAQSQGRGLHSMQTPSAVWEETSSTETSKQRNPCKAGYSQEEFSSRFSNIGIKISFFPWESFQRESKFEVLWGSPISNEHIIQKQIAFHKLAITRRVARAQFN